MGFLIDVFNLILYQPLINVLMLLYKYLPGHDFGIAVIVLTILIRMVFYPLMVKSIKSQKQMQEFQPQMEEIKKKYKDDKERQSKAMMELYRAKKINPLSGCLPLLIQLPIFLALYRIFWKGIHVEQLKLLYPFVSFSGTVDPYFLGIINLYDPHVGIAIIAGICQFFQTKMVTPKTKKAKSKDQMASFTGMMQKQMLYFFPIFTVLILWKLPAAVGLYWIVTALFSVVQQYFIYKKAPETAK